MTADDQRGTVAHMSFSAFAAIRYFDGYLPIEDHGVIGDGATCALVGRDGSIPWLCVPRFDSAPLFASLLDQRRGGTFVCAPDRIIESRQRYVPDSGVLVTQMRGPDGLLELTDALTVRRGADLSDDVSSARGELVRRVHVRRGRVALRFRVEPRGGARPERIGGGFAIRCAGNPGLELHLHASRELKGLHDEIRIGENDRLEVVLRWGHSPYRHQRHDVGELIETTVDAWRNWITAFSYDGPRRELVKRSAITLKLLDHFKNGAIVAAATSSLPEEIGGVRNWDYRYAWVRDCAFSVYALRRIGLTAEAEAFLGWALDAVERHGGPKVVYELDGEAVPPEVEDPELEGYRRSKPVRWGNAAAFQRQNDVYGELLDCAYQWSAGGGTIDNALWEQLNRLVDHAATSWKEPDHGIWEVRTPGRLFTYSVGLCQVALDRGAKLAERHGFPGDIARWRAEADRIRDTILKDAWDDEAEAITEHIGGGELDASVLSLPLRRVLPADHPKMIATTHAVAQRLSAGNGLLYRYLPDESPDGLQGHEGAFLLCSFWLVDNLAYQGRLDEAHELYDSLCDRANPLGLLPEQIDPSTGSFLGNFPQGFSHIGVIASGFNLGRLERDAHVRSLGE